MLANYVLRTRAIISLAYETFSDAANSRALKVIIDA
jgi:hypothetical protein